jgi:hypothetical protein
MLIRHEQKFFTLEQQISITPLDWKDWEWSRPEAYFVKLGGMLYKHGSGEWNYDIYVTSSQLPKPEV